MGKPFARADELTSGERKLYFELLSSLVDERLPERQAAKIAFEVAHFSSHLAPQVADHEELESQGMEPHLSQHVIPHPGGWAILASDNRTLTYIAPDKQTAIEQARKFAEEELGVLVIHAEDGQIEEVSDPLRDY